jgi:GAF domain-containing protein
MLDRIRRLLAAPAFEDEEQTRIARLLHTILLAFFVAVLLVVAAIPLLTGGLASSEDLFTLLAGMLTAAIIAGLMVLTRRGRLTTASVALLSLLWGVITLWIYTFAGVSADKSVIVYPLIIVLAGLLLGGRAAIIFTVLSGAAVAGGFSLELVRGVVSLESSAVFDLIVTMTVISLTGLLLRYAMINLSEALERARSNERAQREANRELQAIRESLEERVARRTRDLERRSVQLLAATEVSRAATSILDPEQLVWQAVELIQERFGFYHVGLFVLDEAGEWAVYRAGGGEAGRRLWEEGFRLEVGGASMVGWCAANAKARVSQDVGVEAIRTEHALVPETQSEAALPLIARGQVIGALSVQSAEVGTFDPETVAALQTMVDQVAVALDNARLFVDSQRALETARRAYGELTRQAWNELLQTRTDWGYSYAEQGVAPVQGDWQPELHQALQAGQPVLSSQGRVEEGDGTACQATEPALAIPLRVRDDVIGVLGFYKDSPDEEWTDQEASLLQRMADRLGAALESAQLFEETQRRAARDRLLGEVTARIRETLDVETVLKAAAREARQALGLPEVVVRLGRPVRSTPSGEIVGRSGAGQGGGTNES